MIQKIASFNVNHELLEPGMYISRKDGNVVTYDLRTRKPNAGDYMDNVTMHTVEHMLATFLRNSSIKDQVIYFGPMGCRTGFYLLVEDSVPAVTVLETLKKALNDTILYDGKVFGASPKECGNYRELELAKAQTECRRYLKVLEGLQDPDFRYPTDETEALCQETLRCRCPEK